MNDPWLQLGVARDADDETIRAAWLTALRRHPPERSPERFEALRAAYERIDTRPHRLAYRLFEDPPPDVEELVSLALLHARAQRSESDAATDRPTEAELRRLLGESVR